MTFDHAANDGGPDSDADDCVDVSDIFHITYLLENPPSSTDCGSCSTPNCLIAGPYTDFNEAELFSNHCSQMNNYVSDPITTSTHITFHSVTSSSDGTIGMVITLQEGGPTDPCGITKVAKLYPAGNNCLSGSAISATSTTANGSQFYNPEWSGLTPNTSYILEIEFTIPNGCQLIDHCESFYYPTSTPPSGCISCSETLCTSTSVTETDVATARVSLTSALAVDGDQYGGVNVGPGVSITLCVPVNVSSGTLITGFKHRVQSSPVGCGSPVDQIITYELTSSACGSVISPDRTNAQSVGSGFNPEWDNLPAGDYILCYTIESDVFALCDDFFFEGIGYYNVNNNPNHPGPCEMQNGSITTCNCEFKDSGGDTGSYSSNEDYTYTICPDDGTKVRFTFSELNLGTGDVLSILDGDNASAPSLYQADDISSLPSYDIDASSSNSSGCLTFVFTSDASDQGTGWLGEISCFTTCSDPVANESSGVIKICNNAQVSLDASSSVANAAGGLDTYNWDFGDGSTGTGVTVSHTYT